MQIATFARFFKTVRTIKTITRSGITVVRDRLKGLNCLKGLNGLNYQSTKKNRSLPKGKLRCRVLLTVFEPYGGHLLTKATLCGKVLAYLVYIFAE